MAESAAHKKVRTSLGKGYRTQTARETAQLAKTIPQSEPEEPAANDDRYMANGQSVKDALYTRHRNRAPKPVKPLTSGPNKPQQKQPGQNKVYTKHVLFALVSAIVIQLVALNKSLPTKG
jgi:hypothetical protein